MSNSQRTRKLPSQKSAKKCRTRSSWRRNAELASSPGTTVNFRNYGERREPDDLLLQPIHRRMLRHAPEISFNVCTTIYFCACKCLSRASFVARERTVSGTTNYFGRWREPCCTVAKIPTKFDFSSSSAIEKIIKILSKLDIPCSASPRSNSSHKGALRVKGFRFLVIHVKHILLDGLYCSQERVKLTLHVVICFQFVQVYGTDCI